MAKKDIEKLWEINTKKAHELFTRRNSNQMEVAGLALEVCDISWGGGKKGVFTLKRFAAEAGIHYKTLSNWVAVRRTVYDQMPKSERDKATFTQLASVAMSVPPGASKSMIERKFDDVVNGDSLERVMHKYLLTFRSSAHNFENKEAATRLSQKALEEFLYYSTIVVKKIRLVHPDLKPQDNGMAANSSLKFMSAAKMMGVKGGPKNLYVKDVDGLLVRLIPKDRDILNYVKRHPGKWLSPTDIGTSIGGHNANSASAWAYRSLNKLLSCGIVERNNKGHYRFLEAK